MNNSPYDGATPEQLRSPMVRELLAVHDMFRSQLTAILEYIEELMAGDQPFTSPQTNMQIQAIIRAGSQYSQMLHFHHHGETDHVFPHLLEDGLEQAVVDRLNSDHDEIAVLIDNFSAAIRQLSTIEPDVLNTDLRRLADALHAHLAYEETHICPFLARWKNWPFMR